MDYKDEIIAKLTKKCMDLREENRKLRFAYNLQKDVVNRTEKINQELSDRIVKSEGLITECEQN